MNPDRQTRTVITLGTTQTLAWASSYYLPAMLAVPMARDLGVATSTVFGAFSAALVASAFLGPLAGRNIDRYGGRPVLCATSLVFAIGLALLGYAQGPVGLFAAWLVIGIGMGSGLYEAAFSALVCLWGERSRGAITGITLIAGFASTVGWPLSTFMEGQLGWRGACFVWAALHLFVGLPLNALLPRAPAAAAPRASTAGAPAAKAWVARPSPAPLAATLMLAFVFAATWFISTAMAAHLPRLLQLGGTSAASAVLIGALIGPSQVGARLLEFGLLRRLHPLFSARLAAAMHPIGAAAFMAFGAPVAALFGIFHGAGNGILTIAKGTLPLAIFGPTGYGRRQGLLMAPARIAQAFAPWLFGLCLDRWGDRALVVSATIGMLALLALLRLPGR